ncbi:uncharacterized protein EKO05_0011047 [Ascochyta rabiei]|nr:uncharacterized protein EKO05_0011047 [Ascochyta rabiei]UPX20830.1 hypothetical protein EKO05_0011047 [Ascochyta rabiei]
MSPSNSVTSTDATSTSTIDIVRRRSGIVPSQPPMNSPYIYASKTKDYLHQPKPQQQPLSSRHYGALQEHADFVVRDYTDVEVPTPRHDTRRGSITWGSRTPHEEQTQKHNRNQMMPERMVESTPPSIEELVRRTTFDDGINTRSSSLMHIDTIVSRPSTTRSSTPGTDIDIMTRSDARRPSVGGLARRMTRRIPDIRLHHIHMKGTLDRTASQSEEDPEIVLSTQSEKKLRKLSFQLPSGLKMKNPPELLHKSPPAIEETPVCEAFVNTSLQNTLPKCGSLAARRHVKMDLTLPIEPPSLSSHKRSPPGDTTSSITPARPQSPKTPWIDDQQLNWGRETKNKPAKSTPIIEETDQAYHGIMAQINSDDVGVISDPIKALPTTASPLASSDFVRPPQKFRDRCYIGRPTVKRNKSGGPSTSESDFGSTPDGHWTPGIEEGMTEQEIRTRDELDELAKTSKTARSRRWPWTRSKASGSDEPSQDERSVNRMNMSANIFKRSNRFPEIPEKEEKEKNERKGKKPHKGLGPPWRREKSADRPPLSSASLANISVPPTFVPPGCEKFQTPPMFDAASEVRGKLADFFFESGGFSSTRRKQNTSSGGYWDSDAILMSMQTDIHLTNDENDEEGPEGRPPIAFHFGPVNDTPGNTTSPGLMTSPEGYLTVKDSGTGALPLTPGAARDSWFRMHYGDYTRDEKSLTAAALKEADERRKFEWLVPDHLPNSPLCPLHVKYVGPSKGLCYWHGRKSNGWGVELGRDYVNRPVTIGGSSSAGWDTGRIERPKDEKKRRRLQSLSSS